MRMKLSIQFQGEEGIDAGGVSREWYQVCSPDKYWACVLQPAPFLNIGLGVCSLIEAGLLISSVLIELPMQSCVFAL